MYIYWDLDLEFEFYFFSVDFGRGGLVGFGVISCSGFFWFEELFRYYCRSSSCRGSLVWLEF